MIHIKPMFSKKDLQAMHDRMNKDVEADILSHLVAAAKQAVEIVRTKQGASPYDDQTGNLNSSTGFIITRLGKIVHSDFKASAKGTDKKTGVATGRKIARANIDKSADWQIVMVAGMEYASWVQQNHSRDVLASATGELPNSIGSALQELRRANYS